MPNVSQVAVQSSHDRFQAVRLFNLKLVEEHADSGTTQCADEGFRTVLIRRRVRLVVMTATGAVAVSPPTEIAMSLPSVRMGVLVVMTATGAVKVLPPTGMAALSLSSMRVGCWW